MKILITGASSGIGAALAKYYAHHNHELYLSGRDSSRLAEVAETCRKYGASNVFTQIIDTRERESMREWLKNASPLDLVFANAGVSTGEENEPNSRNTFEININGTLNTVFPAIEFNAKQIVITASIAGYGPLKACPAYSATKSCLKTWGLSLRGMLAPKGIKVNVICPGFIRSRITDHNTCPMPFFLEAEAAAKIIAARVEKNIGLIAFPWPMRFATWSLSCLPYRLNEFINRLLPKKVI